MFRLFASIVLSAASFVLAEAPTTQPHAAKGDGKLPYRIVAEERTDPPMRLWVLQVDLTNPHAAVMLSPGGPDPDGAGPWQTTLMPVTQVAERERFDVAVNASFFAVDKTGEWQGKGYTTDQPAAAVGWTMTDGKQWSQRENAWPVLWVDANGKAHITATADINSTAQQMVAGNSYILKDGQAQLPEKGVMTVRHPRTAVGIDDGGTTLTILTVDGRQPGRSIGMTGKELADELRKYNVHTAINLDGGGSTTLVERSRDDGQLKIINKPSEGRERPVANVLGVRVRN